MKKILMTICALLLCIALLAGCTKPEPPADPAPAPEEPAAEETTEATEEEAPEEEPAEEVPEEESAEAPVEEPAEEPEEPAENAEPKHIVPLPETLDINALSDCTVAVSLEEGGVSADSAGGISMTVTVYSYNLYDMVDISEMKVGDTIQLADGELEITALEVNDAGTVLINGGLEVGGFELVTDENGVYYERGFNDIKSYHAIGEITVPVIDNFVLTDETDFGSEPVSYEVTDLMGGNVPYYFFPHNTTLTISGGCAIAMARIYTP